MQERNTGSSLKFIVAAIIVAFAVSLFWLSRIYAFLTIAFVLAYLLDPIVERLTSYKFFRVDYQIPRSIGALIILALFFLLMLALAIALIPAIIAQGQELIHRLPEFYASLVQWLGPVSTKWFGFNVFEEVDKLYAALGPAGDSSLVKPITGIVQGVVSQTFKVITTFLGFLIIPLLSYYLLRDYPELYGNFLYVVPKRHHKTVSEIRDRIHAVLGGFLRGQLVVSSILSVYYAVALTALGLQLSLVLGLLAGFLNMVPYVGILSVLGLTWLVALIHGAAAAKQVGIVAVFVIGMAAEGSFLTPRIVGRKVGLGPLTLIVALLVGGELLGFVGMLLAVPVAAIAKVFVVLLLDRYRKSDTFNRSGQRHESA